MALEGTMVILCMKMSSFSLFFLLPLHFYAESRNANAKNHIPRCKFTSHEDLKAVDHVPVASETSVVSNVASVFGVRPGTTKTPVPLQQISEILTSALTN